MTEGSPRLTPLGDESSWSLLEAAPDAVLIVDERGDIVFANSHASALFGPEADLVGRSVEDLIPVDARSTHVAHRHRYQAAPTVRPMGAGLLLRARRTDGSEFPVELSLSPLLMGDASFTVAALRDVSARLAAEQALRRSRDALQEAEQVLVVANDRERIARDLHDTVIQRLFGAGLQLQATMGSVDEPIRQRLQATVDDLDETIKELRAAIFALQGSGPAPGGLRGRLFAVVRDAGTSLGFEPRLQFDGPIESMDDRTAEQLLAVLREALANVARHAKASNVRISISTGHGIGLTVEDDGVGVPGEILGGRGLANLAARAEQLGGHFAIGPAPGGGTLLTWHVPERL
jgi:PAS domain S-box-containing protein